MTIQLEAAQKMLLDMVQTLGTEVLPLAQCSQRVLAETVTAELNFPPFDRSPLDGYAVIAADVQAARPDSPVVLRQIDMIAAGSVSRAVITSGTACRIMTGAPLPSGATGVVRVEDTDFADGMVRIFAGGGIDQNICRAGEEIAAGEEVIQAGTVINAGVMGMLAVLGKACPLVYKKPKVSLLATGSELVSPDMPLAPGKIRNSNSYMLSGQVENAGGRPAFLGQARDEVEAIASVIAAAPACDMTITTGGASVGDYDLIGEVFARLGIDILFEKVSIKPGMPVLAGVKSGKMFIGLSGNPAAASISFETLIRPVLLKMGGRQRWQRPKIRATLARDFCKSSEARRFVWAYWWQDGKAMLVEPLHYQGNGMLKSAMGANCLIVIPTGTPPLASGSEVDIELLAEGVVR
ncbi:gephyrin-like molybdotransferase Glp [Acetonema longum]|uniref:Molybdopterin molybdenumtransferase n=1 Tax=Acetonema longum DSM 6540 TaxID=1009370 RepID=F7NI67_9FIRM|nr:gephyrin-like molybdotransferase Glp [Acetonema longum]EGO64299.1 molybdenum cofactor synthesis domain-containing protein [Acetonema longum DSM 6540]